MSRPTLHGFYAPPTWVEQALCAQSDPGLFFPEHGGPENSLSTARKICARCPVRQECLDYALDYESGLMGIDRSYCFNGVWGGTSPEQRKAILRARSADVA